MTQSEFRSKSRLLLLIARSYEEGDRIRLYAPKSRSRHWTKSDGKRASKAMRESPGTVPLKAVTTKGEVVITPFGKLRFTESRTTLVPAPYKGPGRYRLPSNSTIPKHVK